MKLQFKHQQFQADAARAVCAVFSGQPYMTPTYLLDRGNRGQWREFDAVKNFTGWNNHPVVVSDAQILDNLRKVQLEGNIKPSEKLDGKYNLTVEMETGVGKTYTYIKTMYELNKHYGWLKFIIVVPSIAIREGVYKSFQITQDHFAAEYGKKIRFFIYDSSKVDAIEHFAAESAMNVMIINSQAFNARGEKARRIYMKLDSFNSRKPIDIIAQTNPIVIIDEPQSVEGKVTREKLKEFNPLITLRYSATHRPDSIYNMVYKLDAVEAYNKKLVKKIEVKGFRASSDTATAGYVFLESVNLSAQNPTATIEFDIKGKKGIGKKRRVVAEGFNLYEQSDGLEEYKNGFVVSHIDGRDNSLEFVNGLKLLAGDIHGSLNEGYKRRLQIRETIFSHMARERQLFHKGIKVLSLFFIDEVAKYKQYDASGNALNGVYADIFEEEYANIVEKLKRDKSIAPDYLQALQRWTPQNVHAGYFSIDKNKKTGKDEFVNGKIEKKSAESEDDKAYDLIMKDKERLLDQNEPARFIFSHSALREGWDNPNVFQICALKQSGSEVRKRQEVGRGLRLCVNQQGERMDESVLGSDVQNLNVLTIIASESYDQFAKGLQLELAEVMSDRPQRIKADLFLNRDLRNAGGDKLHVNEDLANEIYESLVKNGYVEKGMFTKAWYDAKADNTLRLPEKAQDYAADIVAVLNTVYDPQLTQPINARSKNVDVKLDEEKLNSESFKKLWSRINAKSAYVVRFETDELINNSVEALNEKLEVNKIYYTIESGTLKPVDSRADLLSGKAFTKEKRQTSDAISIVNDNVKYDLLGKIVAETGLTRAVIAQILKKITPAKFKQFHENPEDFIIKVSNIINEQKASIIIESITYNKLTATYDTDIFADANIKGQLGINTMPAKKHLYDHVRYDSEGERRFAENLESADDKVMIYVKLPKGFYISTPVGKYNPDWAIVFDKKRVKYVYFVAETKGRLDSLELRKIEEAKIKCAKKHFEAISSGDVTYDVVDSFDTLLNKVMK